MQKDLLFGSFSNVPVVALPGLNLQV